MNRIIFNNMRSSFTLILIALALTCNGQAAKVTSNDSLSLKAIITKVISSHPTVKAAEEALNNADARIGLANTGFLPEVDATASFSNIGPVTKLTIPNMGTFQLYPENNYSASINYRQVVYDFGRTRQNIKLETESKSLAEISVGQVKQKLSLYAVNSYYSLLFLQKAVILKDEQLATLKKHLEFVEKKKATGTATDYQILTTQVKISAVEGQKTDMLASVAAQKAALNSLLGNDQNVDPVVKNEIIAELPAIQSDSLVAFALKNRDEVLLNDKKTSLAGLKLDMIKLTNKPVINLMGSAGGKNGYVPELGKIKPNYVVGLGLKVPIFDANRNKYNISQAQSAITSLSYESEITKRTVTNEVKEAQAYLNAAGKRVSQLELQVTQAQKAYDLAETSFQAGTITNLDLLDANTSVSESILMLLKARIDYAASIVKLKASLGEKIY
jgi:outer membrane protein